MTARSHRTRTDRSDQPVRKLLVLALVGLASQLVDGALGMGYGVTSSSLLLLVGIGPALASASVHLSEIGTTLISGRPTTGWATPTGDSWRAWASRERRARSWARWSCRI